MLLLGSIEGTTTQDQLPGEFSSNAWPIQSIVSLIERGKRTHVGDSLWLALQEYIQKPELFEGAALYNDTAYPPPERKDDTNYNQMIYVRKKYRKVWRAAKRVARITGMGISEWF